tara:strand:- start:194 stop:1882 length:1689 start_codon:yes stop_codon:yes gene_type:complete
MNIDTLVENFYRKTNETESLISEVMKLILGEGSAGSKFPSGTFTYDMIPSPSINELGWGALATPAGKSAPVPVDKAARGSLAQYLKNIGVGGDLKSKIDSLNRFYAGDTFPGPEGSPGSQLRRTISYLIFYKTMTEIITNFNAASAGFTFESFIAVLLDATHGQQIPATAQKGEGTIADIRVYKDGRPISLKLYKEGSLKVGGSYSQLIKDVTGKIPTMEYVAVTKAVTGEGIAAAGHIIFRSFQFTLNNIASVLAYGKKTNMMMLTVPAIFATASREELKQMVSSGDLATHLHMPAKGYVETGPLVKAFYEDVMVAAAAAQQSERLSDEALRAIDDGLRPLLSGEASLPGSTVLVKATGIAALGASEKREAKAILKAAVVKYDLAFAAEKKADTPRKQAFKRRGYLTPKQSLVVLNKLAADGEEDLLREALKSTQGMTGKLTHTQFEISQTQLAAMASGLKGKEDLFPYGQYEIGILQVGAEKIQGILDQSVNTFNATIFQIFTDLKTLSTSLNGYVASGLEKTKLADTAQVAAGDIAKGTEDVADTDSSEPDSGLTGESS